MLYQILHFSNFEAHRSRRKTFESEIRDQRPRKQ